MSNAGPVEHNLFQRLVIVGAGAVGGTIGARLIHNQAAVAMVARGNHGQQIRQAGLRLRSPLETILVEVDCVDSIANVQWRPDDAVLLATKLQDARAAMDQILRYSANGEQTVVICGSNGIQGEAWASERFLNVVSMLIWMPSTFLKPGEVSVFGQPVIGILDCGPVDRTSQQAAQSSRQLVDWLRRAGFESQNRDDIMRWKYAKWITNLGNAAQALVHDDWKKVAKLAQAEGVAVLQAAGIDHVQKSELMKRCQHFKLATIDGQQRPGGSTWQSLHRDQPLETEWLEGAMAALAKQINVPTPVLDFLCQAAERRQPVSAIEVPGAS